MREIASKNILGLLLDDRLREAGCSEIDGKQISWDSGYIVTVLPYGERKGTAIRKFTVLPSMVKEISALLQNVCWGSLVELRLDNNKIIDINVIFDLSNALPIE